MNTPLVPLVPFDPLNGTNGTNETNGSNGTNGTNGSRFNLELHSLRGGWAEQHLLEPPDRLLGGPHRRGHGGPV